MYAYYMLAACGPSLQRFLWWKKYITVLQMVSEKMEEPSQYQIADHSILVVNKYDGWKQSMGESELN